jgi:hypothetical protein
MSLFKKSILLLTPLLILGCSNDDSDQVLEEQSPESSNVRVIHASPDAPTVNIAIDGTVVEFLVGVNYQIASEVFPIDSEMSYEVVVQGNTPAGSVDVLSLNLDAQESVLYDVIAIGSVFDATLEALVFSNIQSDIGSGNVRARVIHTAEDAPAVDVYITALDADLEAAQANATLEYKSSSGYVEVAGGEYQIRITLAGTKTVVFDSGAVNLPAGEDLLVLATTNVNAGDSPVALIVAGDSGSSTVLDKDTPASIRAIHGVADAPNVDIIANNALELFDNIEFTAVTDYADVGADDYLIDVAVASNNDIVAIDDAPITLEAGKFYTAIANNDLANIDLDLISDTPRRQATAAQVRIFHASSNTPSIDIYVTPDGVIADVEPSITDLSYMTGDLSETGYVLFPAGDYIVTVTPADTKTIAIETELLTLETNKIYTAFAVNSETSGGAPILILADDF